jgi:hypothetical protein
MKKRCTWRTSGIPAARNKEKPGRERERLSRRRKELAVNAKRTDSQTLFRHSTKRPCVERRFRRQHDQIVRRRALDPLTRNAIRFKHRVIHVALVATNARVVGHREV